MEMLVQFVYTSLHLQFNSYISYRLICTGNANATHSCRFICNGHANSGHTYRFVGNGKPMQFICWWWGVLSFPDVWASCLFGLFGGALGRIRHVDREILVIVYYASQKVFLEEHLAYSWRSCLEGVASGLELRVPDRCWSMLERLRLELPGGAGGAEVDVAFLSVPRRAPEAIRPMLGSLVFLAGWLEGCAGGMIEC